MGSISNLSPNWGHAPLAKLGGERCSDGEVDRATEEAHRLMRTGRQIGRIHIQAQDQGCSPSGKTASQGMLQRKSVHGLEEVPAMR